MTNLLLAVGAAMFGIGMLGFLTRRNLILMFLSLEMMLAGVSLNFIAFGHLYGDLGGQVFVLLILTVAACEAALALSLIVALYRSRGSLDINVWQSLRESTLSDEERSELMAGQLSDGEESTSYGDLPKLTPAGRDPMQFPAAMETSSRDLIHKA
ncbi:MAG: NADH-quinone oxidoreductase subunit NuoK [Pirellulaceae bacterium]|nr:NADH-quinone oxidoreductase subunit NuoK [Pirellulaceae bacterium]